jgi:serine/threonine-protein kinase 24/25/MST4
MIYDLSLNMQRLGTGSFGVVYKAYVDAVRYSTSTDSRCVRIHNASQLPVAIKQIDLEDSDDDITEIQQEISHLAQCDSPYVTRYYTSFVVRHKLWIGWSPVCPCLCCI